MISDLIGSVSVLLPRETGSRTTGGARGDSVEHQVRRRSADDAPASARLRPPTGGSHVDVAVGDAPEHHVRFTSGGIFYAEGMVEDRWAARYWSGDGRIPFPYRFADSSAFELRIKTNPKSAHSTQVSGGWKWVSSDEAPPTDRGARHSVVRLTNEHHPVDVEVHTLLDGTPVLTRWLKVTNTADHTIALTQVVPLAGPLWRAGGPYRLFYQILPGPRAIHPSYDWKTLNSGMNLVESTQGNGYDDPFFIVQNESRGEFFIGHLAWSANWSIEFHVGGGLSFNMGPRANDALRVLGAGESIDSPATHLGYVLGDLDDTVQAMHAHIRRSVVPKLDPERARLVQINTPGDQDYYRGEDFNEENVKHSIDVSAALEAELFLLDCPWYDVYGEWVPSEHRFPNGLKPVVDYAHEKGMLFGIQTEVEGGRGNWETSRVAQEHPEWFGSNHVMRLERDDAGSYMRDELTRVVADYNADMYRNEFIPDPLYTHEGTSTIRDGFIENDYWRYYDN